MILHQTQNIVAADLHRFRTCCNGRRWGKTTLAIEEIKGKALAAPVHIAYIGPTIQQARDLAWNELKRELRSVITYINESRLELKIKTLKGGESIIVLKGWENIETLRGQYYHFLVIDEVAMMRNFWDIWQQILSPTLTDYKGEALFISTPKGYNHFYELFSKDPQQQPVKGIVQDEDFKSFHFTSYDNPFIPREEVDRQQRSLTEDAFAQEFMADFRKMEGLVYKEFSREKHVFTDREDGKPLYVSVDRVAGVDWGFTNPTASHTIEKDTDRHYWIFNEFYHSGKTTAEIIEWVKSTRPSRVYPDPAEPDRNEELKRAGLNIRAVSKDIEAGVNCVRELFKQGRIHIHASCMNLISELETYRYPDKKPDKNDPEIPVKENDHACDEIRYVLYMLEGEVGKGGFAHTHYSQSAQPQTHKAPENPLMPKFAHTHIPKFGK